jgi:Flp pilus assembly protein TadG
MRRDTERGAAIVEMALILPLLIMLVFGIVEFGRAYNTKVTLTHSAREAVRVLAITQDPAKAQAAAVASATTLDAAQLSFTSTACVPGQPTQVTVSYPFSYDIPLINSDTVTLSGQGVMRCGG